MNFTFCSKKGNALKKLVNGKAHEMCKNTPWLGQASRYIILEFFSVVLSLYKHSQCCPRCLNCVDVDGRGSRKFLLNEHKIKR